MNGGPVTHASAYHAYNAAGYFWGDLNAPELSRTGWRTTARQLGGLVAFVLGIIVAAVLAAVQTPSSDEAPRIIVAHCE